MINDQLSHMYDQSKPILNDHKINLIYPLYWFLFTYSAVLE